MGFDNPNPLDSGHYVSHSVTITPSGKQILEHRCVVVKGYSTTLNDHQGQ